MNTEHTAVVTQTDAERIASLEGALALLQTGVAAKPVKVAVSDEAFNAAIAKRDAEARADLETGNPKANPVVGLSAILGVIPDMTKEQRAEYHAWKKTVKAAYSALHRTLLPVRKALLARTLNKPASMVSTVARTRKDGTVQAVGIRASEPAKVRKGKGLKKAKPAQVAAKVPAAGNAVAPAMVS